MVADYHYFIPSDIPSPPIDSTKVSEDRGVVIWKAPPNNSSACTTMHHSGNGDQEGEGEDTDLLNLRFLSLHYPPLEPTRVISLPKQAIPRPFVNMDYARDQWDADDQGRPHSQISYYDSETDSLDSSSRYTFELRSPSNDTNSESQYPYREAHIEEIHSSDNSHTDGYSEEGHSNHPPTFPPTPQIQRLIPFGEYPHIDETSLISPARYHQWTSPGHSQIPTSQLSYEPSRSPESGSLIDHPSADVDQYFDFDAAGATPIQQNQLREVGPRLKRGIEEIEEAQDDSRDDQGDHQQRRVRVDKRTRVRSPRPSPPRFRQPDNEREKTPSRSAEALNEVTDNTVIQQSRGRKRSLEESGHDSVETVLKRPFRTPAPRVVLTRVAPRPKTSSSPQSTPSRPAPAQTPKLSPSKPLVFRSAPTRLPLAPSTQQSSPKAPPASDGPQEFFDSLRAKSGLPKINTPTFKANVKTKAKAFKPPLLKLATGAGGGGYWSSSRPIANSQAESIMGTITRLEKEARVLRQAVRYHSNADEDERLISLIQQWRTAGRDVVEQIYDRIPKPDLDSNNDTNSSQAHHHSQGGSSWYTEGGRGEYELTEEQEKYLKYCPKNEDGEPVDEEGNPLIPTPNPGDLERLVEVESKGRRGESEDYIPTYQNGVSGTRLQKSDKESEPKEWNMGNMMLRFSVDPALLGWDDDLEDWADIDESA